MEPVRSSQGASGRKVLDPFSCRFCMSFFSDLDLYRRHTIRHKNKFKLRSSSSSRPHRFASVFDTGRFESLYNISFISLIIPKSEQHAAVFPRAIHQAAVVKQDYQVSSDGAWSKKRNDCNKGRKLYECKHCGRTFKKRHQLWGHIRVHAEMGYKEGKSKSLQCQYCEKYFAYKCDLSKHISIVHEEQHRFQCPHCGSLFPQHHNLVQHIGRNTKKSRYQCLVCNMYYKSKCQMAHHMEMAHSQTQPGQTDTQTETMKAVQKDEKLPCPLCSKRFMNLATLRSHLKVIHTSGRRIKCKFCRITFKQKAYLRKHVRRVHQDDMTAEDDGLFLTGSPEPKVRLHLTCKLCGKKFLNTTVDLFATHMKRVHLDGGEDVETHTAGHAGLLKCQVCHKLFTKRKYLAEHTKRLHAGKRQKSARNYSTAADQGEQCHRCVVCPAVYTTHHAMLNHMRRKHRDVHQQLQSANKSEATFQCLRCPESFQSGEELKTHIYMKHVICKQPNSPRKTDHLLHLKKSSSPQKTEHLPNRKQPSSPKNNTRVGAIKFEAAGTGGGTFKCGYCLLSFDDRRMLNRHMVQNHAGDEI